MIPKDKAKQLVDKFLDVFDETKEPSVAYVMVKMAKENALICVDEMIQELERPLMSKHWMSLKYWEEVKQYIEK